VLRVWLSCAVLLATPAIVPATQRSDERPQTTAAILVEVVGCLAEAPASVWIVNHATTAAKTTSASTTAAALKEAAAKPLGNGRYRLLGVSVFDPARHKGHKVAVKGVLIKDVKESRLNVTSLQRVSDTCAK